MQPQTEHSWFVARLVERRVGLLEDSAEARLQEHLSQCDKCRELWRSLAVFEDTGREDEVHIPDSILADWATRRKTLRGKLRDLIDQHLDHCPDCRDNVEAHGSEASFDVGLDKAFEHHPAMAATPLAGAPGAHPSARTAERPSPTPASSPLTRRARFAMPTLRPLRLAWLNWAVAGWAVTATGILLLHPRTVPVAPESAPEGVLPWVAPGVTRGPGNVLRVPSSARAILLRVEMPPEWPAGTAGTIEVSAPAGDLLLRAPATAADVSRGEIMLVVRTPAALPEGTYHVRFLPLGAPGNPPERIFALEHGAP